MAETSGGKWQVSTFVIVVVRFRISICPVSDKLSSVSYRQIEKYSSTLRERFDLSDRFLATTTKIDDRFCRLLRFFQYLLDLSLGCMSSFGFAKHSLSVPRIHYVVDLVTIPSY
jgi:hypothetical protein